MSSGDDEGNSVCCDDRYAHSEELSVSVDSSVWLCDP